MIYLRLVPCVLGLLLCLQGCNTTDVLTPPADVGDGSQTASTPSDGYSTMAADSDADTFPEAPANTANQQAFNSPPQNSLDAQAQSLAAGNAPMQPPPSVYGNSVSQTPPQQTQQPAAAQQLQASAATGATIRFLPIIGAPVEAVTPLSRQLGAEARAKGLTIKGASDPASQHILKGYFSAFGDSGNVSVVYVWDILDAGGARLHRIQGQESFPSASSDPWSAVPAELMQRIATRTIADYMSWRGTAG